MADAITVRKNGFHEMAAAQGVAIWWEVGGRKAQRLTGNENTQELLEAAGMDFEYKQQPVRYVTVRNGQRMYAKFPDRVVLVRSDNGEGLSVVSPRFKVRQPREIVGFFDDLIRFAGFKMNSLGTLHGGVKIWAQADVGAETIGRGDFNKGKLLLAEAIDGSMMTTAKGVNESVVCANTLGFALSEKGGTTVRVSHRSVFDEAKVKQQLGVTVDNWVKFIAQAKGLARQSVGPQQAEVFVAELLGADFDTDDEKQVAKNAEIGVSKNFLRIMELFNGAGRGSDLPSRKGTLWGLVNGVTDFVDHDIRAHSVDNRLDSALFGNGDELKTAAFTKALDLIA